MSFNTDTYNIASRAYNVEKPVYINGTNTISVSGNTYYAGKFPDVMCGFCVDNVDTVLGGNVIVSNDVKVCGNLAVTTGSISGNSVTQSTSNNSTALATTSFVKNQAYAPLAGTNQWTGSNTYSALPSCTATPSGNNDLTNKLYVDNQVATKPSLSTSNTWTNANTFNNILPTSTLNPSNTTDLTTKSYVDTAVSGVNPNSLLSASSAWTGTNTYNTNLPTSTIICTNNRHFAVKQYVDSAANTASSNATTSLLSSSNAWAGNNTFSKFIQFVGAISSNIVLGGTGILSNITSGSFLTAIGTNILTLFTSGTDVIAIGNNILQAFTSTTDSHNFCFGSYILGNATTGSNNIAIGNTVLNNTTGSSNNIGIGVGVLGGITGSNGSNIAIGNSAGIRVTGPSNILIGNNTGQDVGDTTSYSNSIAIGNSAIIPASNTIVLGASSIHTSTLLQSTSTTVKVLNAGNTSIGGTLAVSNNTTLSGSLSSGTTTVSSLSSSGTINSTGLVTANAGISVPSTGITLSTTLSLPQTPLLYYSEESVNITATTANGTVFNNILTHFTRVGRLVTMEISNFNITTGYTGGVWGLYFSIPPRYALTGTTGIYKTGYVAVTDGGSTFQNGKWTMNMNPNMYIFWNAISYTAGGWGGTNCWIWGPDQNGSLLTTNTKVIQYTV